MAKPPLRRLTLADLVILTAGVAVALLLYRLVQQSQATHPASLGLSRGFLLYINLSPFLIAGFTTLLASRLIGPRPPLRVVLGQPGTIGAVAYLLSFAFNTLLCYGEMVMGQLANQPTFFSPGDIQLLFLYSFARGEVVSAVWATLAVTGRWQPEPSWVDRSGRALGVIALLAGIVCRVIP